MIWWSVLANSWDSDVPASKLFETSSIVAPDGVCGSDFTKSINFSTKMFRGNNV